MNEQNAILAANAAFYAAIAAADVAALAQLWADDDDISCIHPGWPAIIGRTAVIGSWRDILSSAARPQILCREPYAILARQGGHVLCIELVESAALAVSNHYRLVDDVWRMVHHQASPIAHPAELVLPDPSVSPRRVH